MTSFPDFEYFKNDYTWFFKPKDKIELAAGELPLGPEFEKTFPGLHALVGTARITDVKINKHNYKLLAWTLQDGEPCGWLCLVEDAAVNDLRLLPEHKLLLQHIGGIKESFNQPDGSFSNNQNFLFVQSLCEKGLGGWEEVYLEECNYVKAEPLPIDELITFVQEANGNITVYHMETKQVYLYAHDHAFDNVTAVPGQPEYTFHYINDVNNFVDYVEALAKQWTEHLSA